MNSFCTFHDKNYYMVANIIIGNRAVTYPAVTWQELQNGGAQRLTPESYPKTTVVGVNQLHQTMSIGN